MTEQTIRWLHGLAEKGGKGVVNNIDARCLGRVADDIVDLVIALDWAMARVIKKAPHHAHEGDAELYSFAYAHSLLAKFKNAMPQPSPQVTETPHE